MLRAVISAFSLAAFALAGAAFAAAPQSPDYAATAAALQRIAQQSSQIETVDFGKSAEGRTLVAAIVAADGTTTPAAARAAHKAVVFVVGGIDVGDLAGKDAVSAWLGRLAAAAQAPAWLRNVVVVAVPALNADGITRLASAGTVPVAAALAAPFQGTPGLVDLSTDFLYAHSPAVRAWLSLVANWHPDAYAVLRTDLRQPPSQYRLTWSTPPAAGLAAPVAHWQSGVFGALGTALDHAGLTTAPCYRAHDPADPEAGLTGCVPEPGSLAQLAMLDNRPEVTFVLPRAQDYAEAVAAGEQALQAVLAGVGAHASDLLDAVAAADRSPGMGGDGAPVAFDFPGQAPHRRFDGYAYVTMLSPISGGVWARFDHDRPKTYFLPWATSPAVTQRLAPWQGYAVPAAWSGIIDLLALHGVVMHRLAAPAATAVRAYFVTGSDAPGGASARSRFTAAPHPLTVTLPAGSALVPAAQPAAKLVAALLEPRSPVSLAHGGYLERVFGARVPLPNAPLEEHARDELSKDPALAREFARRLEEDPGFAASPARRLAYFVQHGSGLPPLLDVYPVYELGAPPNN